MSRPPEYDWNLLTNGEWHRLEAGKDFTGRPDTWRHSFHRKCWLKYGLRARTRTDTEDRNVLWVRAYKPEEGT